MVYINDISITNPVETGKTITIEISISQEYENSKYYPNKYPYRYGEKGEQSKL